MMHYCSCGRQIKVFMRAKGWVPAPDDDHDLCDQCWRSLRDSQR